MSANLDPITTFLVTLTFVSMALFLFLFCVLFFYFWYKSIQEIGEKEEQNEKVEAG